MKYSIKGLLMAGITASLAFAGQAFAIPTLQLDIGGGTYDTSTATIVATGNPFKLYALINAVPSGDYYISAAIIGGPALSYPGSYNLGSFTLGGTTVNVTSDMNYGTPPVESAAVSQPFDAGDLSKHSIFPAYFKEFKFNFDPSNQITAYNAADRATAGAPMDLTHNGSGGMYFAAFDVDVSHLDPAYRVHFDLYNKTTNSKGGLDVGIFAPFSHDAQSGTNSVPEPGTLLLLGSGLTGLWAWRSRRAK